MTRSRSSRGYDDDRYGYPEERGGRPSRGRDPYDMPRRGNGSAGGPGGGSGGGPGGGGFQFNVASGAILAGVLVVVFVRGKRPDEPVIELARRYNMPAKI